eukprot:236245_1
MTSVEHIRTKVLELITIHEPDKTCHVDVLMEKYKGKENYLLKTLREKYNKIQMKKVYCIGPKLDSGAVSLVRKVKRRSDGKIFALKIINKKRLLKDEINMIQTEISIHRQLSHSNIVKLYDVFHSKSKTCLVLELCEGGKLCDKIIQECHLTEKYAANIFYQLCDAFKYIHSQHIVHRGLKPEDILFSTKENDSPIKLIDFGLADHCKDHLLNGAVGAPQYMAPEMLRFQPYGTSVDMWSLGVILYIILCGFPPFYDENDDIGKLRRKIKRVLDKYDMSSVYWDMISNEAKDLVGKLLVIDPKKRLTAEQALQHKWFRVLRAKCFDIKYLKTVDKKVQYIVFGYIRSNMNAETTIYNTMIPYYTLAYYHKHL